MQEDYAPITFEEFTAKNEVEQKKMDTKETMVRASANKETKSTG
jgi:hypothetical protein